MLNYTRLNPELCDFVAVATSDEIPNGERLHLEIDEYPIVIFRIAGHLFAIGDVCSHDDGPVGDGELEEYEIICPRHGARFDVRNGEVRSLPAIVDIPAYPVIEEGGEISIGLPRENL